MISNPEFGWCDFSIGDFYGNPSYITDVPVDLLRAFVDLFKRGCGVACFDEEGAEFTLVLTPYSIFVIEEREQNILYDCSNINPKALAMELISDIRSQIQKWAEFIPAAEDSEIEERLQNIAMLINDLLPRVE